MVASDLEERSRQILGHLYDVAGVGMCVTDEDRRYAAINQEYCKTYGYTTAELLGKEFTMVLPKEQRKAAAELHDSFLLRGEGEVSGEWRVVRKDGSFRTVLVTAGRLELDGSRYKVTTVYEVNHGSRGTRADDDRRNALREINHRVKNHLSTLQSMLDLQLEESRGEDKIVGILTDSINRIKSINRLYDRLQVAPEAKSINLRDYLDGLLADLVKTGGRDEHVEIRRDVEDLQLTVEQATSLGLVLNELVTNSLKHGIPENDDGWISVSLGSEATHIALEVSDSGPGVPPDYLEEHSETLGMQIITAIVSQHEGEFFLKDPSTSTFVVRLPRIID